MKSLSEFSKDLVKYIPSFFVPVVVSFVFIPLFTRYLAPDEWGDFVIVQNTIQLFTMIGMSWLNAATVRFYAQSVKENNSRSLISTVIAYGLFSALIVILIAGFLVYFAKGILQRDGLFDLVFLGLWGLFGRSLFVLFSGIFRAQRKINVNSLFTSWEQISRLILGAYFVVVLNLGTRGLIAGWSLGLIVGVIVFGACYFFHQFDFRQVSHSMAKSLFLYGVPIVGGDIAFWFLRLSDRYILRIFRNASEVGIYAVGVDLSDRSLSMLVSLLATSSWPLVVQIWENEGVRPTSRFLTQLMRIYLIVCIPGTTGISLLSRPIIRLLADDAYYEGYHVMTFIAAGVFLYGFQRWFQLILALHEKTFKILISVLAGAVLNILLNFIFVPSFGYKIAAVNNLLGYLVFTILVVLFSRKIMKWRFPFKSLIRILLASLFMLGGITVLRTLSTSDWLTLVLCVPGGVLFYLLALFGLKEITFSDLGALRGLFAKR